MCGIAGVYSIDSRINHSHVESMSSEINHRGPDGEGFFQDENISLAHKRLKILDLTEAGHQPMFSLDGTKVIIFNGEIYNYKELRGKLTKKGYTFNSETDTEVLLEMYSEYGANCLNFLNGMFSFAIWDIKNNELFCARDRFGIKPFYYSQIDGMFIFCSEIKGILAHKHVVPKPNEKNIHDYLIYGLMDHNNETFFEDINQLPASHYLRINSQGIEIKKYYSIQKRGKLGSNKLRNLEKLFTDSVELRLRSDVPVGLLLSGGIDSSAVGYVMSKLKDNHSENKIESFSSGAKNAIYDETEYVDLALEEINAKKNIVYPSGDNLVEKLSKIIWHHDEPLLGTSLYAHWHLFEMVEKTDIIVLLQGQGADEILYGYDWYDSYYLADLIKEGKFGNYIRSVFRLSKIRQNKVSFFIRNSLEKFVPDSIILEFKNKFQNKGRFFNFKDNYDKSLSFPTFSKSSLENRALADIFVRNLPYILHYEDRNSMAFSRESRIPFLDYRIVDYIFSLPRNFKLSSLDRKISLKRIMRNKISSKILNRKDKMGFSTPMDDWLTGSGREAFLEVIKSNTFKNRKIFNSKVLIQEYNDYCSGKKVEKDIIWRSLCLELWYQNFIDN